MFLGVIFGFIFTFWSCGLIQGERSDFEDSLTDLHEYRKSVVLHEGDKEVFMLRNTDEKIYSSIDTEEESLIETAETFSGRQTMSMIWIGEKEEEDDYKNIPKTLKDLLDGSSYKKLNRTKRSAGVPSLKKTNNWLQEFQHEFLKAHNDFRLKHGVPPLKLNNTLNELSQIHAERLHATNQYEKSDKNKLYGENIYEYILPDPNYKIKANDIVTMWYNEIGLYNTFGQEPEDDFTMAPHFTQVIWKDTKELGVGLAHGDGSIYVVAYYYPPGNRRSEYIENVNPVNDSDGNANSRTITRGEFNKEQFVQDILKAHNEYRARHKATPLELDPKISQYAQEWADTLTEKKQLGFRPNNQYGENIYKGAVDCPRFTNQKPVDVWYNVIKDFTFGVESKDIKGLFFSQVVWKSTKFIGVGTAIHHGSIIVVVDYFPPGNIRDKYIENVSPEEEQEGQIKLDNYF